MDLRPETDEELLIDVEAETRVDRKPAADEIKPSIAGFEEGR